MTASIVGWAHTPFGKFDAESVESLIVRVATDAIAECLDRGLLVGSAGERVLRITPPLTITDDELKAALATLEEVLS